jgi:hypothetical protein
MQRAGESYPHNYLGDGWFRFVLRGDGLQLDSDYGNVMALGLRRQRVRRGYGPLGGRAKHGG